VSAPHTVIVKFRRIAGEAEQRAHLSGLAGDEIVAATGIFPGDDELELATLVEVRVGDRASPAELVQKLERDDEIEYAHEQVERQGLEDQGDD
jgi:hypothetical protein